jgi:decaprenylphospho-beta-D-erythro-pentofuranosid-2-ulose 2-reductase
MNLLILGANSDVADAVEKKFAQLEKAQLFLASRDLNLLEKRAQDLRIRYQVRVEPLFFDATNFASHQDFYDNLQPKPDGVILAFGYLGDQARGQEDFNEAKKIIDSNFLGAVSILEIIAGDFARRGHGFIIAISSVAGERGRRSNYLYGAAKGALTIYLSGLRNRLHDRRVRVMTVLPGFIQTKMSEHLQLPEKLVALPDEVAEDIYLAYKKGKDVIYTIWIWKWIMRCIKALPESIFKRLNI